MNIDAMKLDSIASVETIEKMDFNVLPLSTLFAVEALRTRLMENVVLITALQRIRRSHPGAAFKAELYLEGVE